MCLVKSHRGSENLWPEATLHKPAATALWQNIYVRLLTELRRSPCHVSAHLVLFSRKKNKHPWEKWFSCFESLTEFFLFSEKLSNNFPLVQEWSSLCHANTLLNINTLLIQDHDDSNKIYELHFICLTVGRIVSGFKYLPGHMIVPS